MHGALLQEFESKLREKLEAANAPPFIGLLDVAPEDRERIRGLVREKIAGDFQRVSWTFNATPAAAAWSVAGALTEDYGEQDAAVYRLIEETLGISLRPPGRRDKLHAAFSDVCRRFGLALFRDRRKVDAYLVQAGVSRPQLPDVIEAFLRAERAFGPPPTHATAALNAWEDEALDFLSPGLRVPRYVLETDDTGFFAAAFARCRSGAISQTEFERYFQSVLENVRNRAPSARRRQNIVARPKLVWSDGALALSVPRLEGRLGSVSTIRSCACARGSIGLSRSPGRAGLNGRSLTPREQSRFWTPKAMPWRSTCRAGGCSKKSGMRRTPLRSTRPKRC